MWSLLCGRVPRHPYLISIRFLRLGPLRSMVRVEVSDGITLAIFIAARAGAKTPDDKVRYDMMSMRSRGLRRRSTGHVCYNCPTIESTQILPSGRRNVVSWGLIVPLWRWCSLQNDRVNRLNSPTSRGVTPSVGTGELAISHAKSMAAHRRRLVHGFHAGGLPVAIRPTYKRAGGAVNLYLSGS